MIFKTLSSILGEPIELDEPAQQAFHLAGLEGFQVAEGGDELAGHLLAVREDRAVRGDAGAAVVEAPLEALLLRERAAGTALHAVRWAAVVAEARM